MLIWKIVVPLATYLLGNFNSAIIFSWLIYRKDVREYGSKNAGTTNAFRTFGKGAGALVLVFDALKGIAAILLAKCLLPGQELWAAVAGFCVTLGHIFPVVFKFKGGKGMATSAGVLGAAQPKVLLTLLAPFLLLCFGTRYMSLASVSVAMLSPLVTLAWNGWHPTPLFWANLALAVLITFMHRENIKRLLNGTENKLFGKKKEGSEAK